MVVRKYFQFIEIWAPCPICEKLGYAPMVNLRVSKEEINRGLSMGIYTHNYVHGPPGQEHTVSVYINPKYEMTGSKAFEGTEGVNSDTFAKGTIIPIIIKKIPDMAVHLGMVTPEEFSILKVCDGNNSIDEVAKILEKDRADIEESLQKLKDKGLVDLIKKA
ncbi:MAG: helix-turn-helix domain-containing protein [Promethearchaeota archaeon]